MMDGAHPAGRRIPPPTGERVPLKANIFAAAHVFTGVLIPLFPYQGEGAIVPCVVLQRGGPGKDAVGTFVHENQVDEVVLVFGTRGAGLQAGQVLVSQKLHGVNTFLKDPTDEGSFTVIAVTQRQLVGRPQPEAIVFRCQKCAADLMRLDFDGLPDKNARYPSLSTLSGTVAAHARYNAEESRRTCGRCGHVSKPFPLGPWGWENYLSQGEVVNDARRVMEDAARAQLEER
jgi:hypothetical protein